MTVPPRHPLHPRAVLTAVAVVLAVLGVLALAYLAWRVITWIVIALFITLALEHGVRFFQERGLRRSWSIATVFVLALSGATGLGFLFIPPLVNQITEFASDLPDIIERLAEGRGPLGALEREFDLVERARTGLEAGDGGASAIVDVVAGPLLTVVESAVVVAVAIVSIVFMTLFMLLYGPSWRDGVLGLLPEPQRPSWERAARGIYDAIGGWVVGAIAIAVVAGVSATVVLVVLDVPYAFTLGLLVGILDPIPFLGATLAAAIVAAVVFATEGIVKAAIFLGFIVLYQQVENHLLYPLVYGRTVQLTPLAVLLAVLIGGELAGILGALAAIPIGGAIKVVAGEVLRYRRDRIAAAPGAKRTAA